MNRTTYVDITQLLEWQGRLTGVPRVMDELARRLSLEDGYDFISWDGVSGAFYAATYDDIKDREPLPVVASTAGLALHKRGKIYSYVRSVAKKSRIARAIARRIKMRLRVAAAESTEMRRSIEINGSDRIFILWGSWADEGYINKVMSLRKSGVEVAQIVYDMLPLVTPQFSGHSTDSLQRYATNIYPICSVLLSISEHTKRDLTKWLSEQKLTVPPIEIIRLGEDFKFSEPVMPISKIFLDADLDSTQFILCVGTVEVRKNHTLLYYTYRLAAQRGVTLPKLAIVGRRGWMTDDIYNLVKNDPVTKDSLIFLEDIGDEELSWLYNHCLFSIYPSFYEGWGLPIAESVSRGVPCIASNASSMPEIAGELIGYFSPFSADECLEKIVILLDSETRGIAKRKLKSYKPTTWQQTFLGVKKILEK